MSTVAIACPDALLLYRADKPAVFVFAIFGGSSMCNAVITDMQMLLLVFLPCDCCHGSLLADVADVGWLAVGEESTIRCHEIPPLAEAVISVVGEQVRQGFGVQHGGE